MVVNVNPRDALNQIRRWIGERGATSYTRNGCRVSLANLPRERVVLDVDLAFPTDRAVKAQCDFILFYTSQDTLVAVPMELKQGDVDASEVVKQLQEGAHIVNRLVPRNVETNCIPVLIHGSKRVQSRQNEKLKRSSVNFRGVKLPIQTTRCSYEGNLAKALNIK